MCSIYDQWKPLRNFLRKLDSKVSLEVLRYYSLFDPNIKDIPPNPPNYIEVHPSIFRQNNGIYPWDIEILAREVIYAAEDINYTAHSFTKWKDFSKAINFLKAIEEAVSKKDINPNNVLRELFRLSHREFPHQTDTMNKAVLVRYSKLFSYGNMSTITCNKLGLSVDKILTIGFTFWSQFQSHAAITKPSPGDIWNKIGISIDEANHFLDLFSRPFAELKKIVLDNHRVDNTFFYQYNPLSAYPLVEFDRNHQITYICPSVNKFQSRFTRGLYYELYNEPGFDNAFGDSFQQYVGEVLNATITEGLNVIYGEEIDTSNNKRRCDWIIDQESSFTMIECKTKRIAMSGYTSLEDEPLNEQLSKLADAIVQTYQGYLIYRDIGYKNQVYPFNKQKTPSICIVTLEKWYMFGQQLKSLTDIVKTKLIEKNIDFTIMTEVPFAVVGVDEFERLAYLVLKGYDLADMIKSYSNPSSEASSWEFSVFINAFQNNELENYDYIFKDKMDEVFTPEMQLSFKKANDIAVSQ
jgi:hypothetical protein